MTDYERRANVILDAIHHLTRGQRSAQQIRVAIDATYVEGICDREWIIAIGEYLHQATQ
jgi:hypothetical protein